jgi:hypothetical protein
MGVIFQTTDLPTNLRIKTVVSKFKRLVFNSEKFNMTAYGFAKNWNKSGYFEVYGFLRK